MATVLWIILTLCIAGLAHLFIKAKKDRGPVALPIIGHLHLLYGSLPHHALFQLSKTYGPLMLLHLGSVPTFVVSNAHAAQQVLRIHEKNFLSRPAFAVAEHVSYNFQSLAMVPHGELWKKLRKICNTLLLNRSRLESFKALRMDMVSIMLDSVTHAAAHEKRVLHLCSLLMETTFNIITMMLMSKRYFGSGIANESEALQFTTLQMESTKLVDFFYAGDFLPILNLFKGLHPKLRALKRLHHSQDMFLQGILDERRKENKGQQEISKENKGQQEISHDILDLLLSIAKEEQLSDIVIKALLQDLLNGSTETTSTTIEWAVAELIRHPQAMTDLRQELDQVVGEKSLDESHLSSLPYLDCVVKETLRLHPPAPSLGPRLCTAACIIEGLAIPKNAMLFVNWFAMGRDSTYWEHPNEFIPKRFIDNHNHGSDFMFIPFGGGRSCRPGELLGMTMVKVVVGSLIHRYDWALENGLGIDDLT